MAVYKKATQSVLDETFATFVQSVTSRNKNKRKARRTNTNSETTKSPPDDAVTSEEGEKEDSKDRSRKRICLRKSRRVVTEKR